MCQSFTKRIVEGFCDQTLPKEQWTHEAHLRTGLWHVLRHGPDEALVLLRERMSAYNLACGNQNTDDAGYHETITRFYVWRIAKFAAGADCTRSIEELAAELISLLADQRAPFEYYSRERLMSVEARRGWVAPDLRPLDA